MEGELIKAWNLIIDHCENNECGAADCVLWDYCQVIPKENEKIEVEKEKEC